MITVLVKYKRWEYGVEQTKIIEVDKLTDLNKNFMHDTIIDIKILKEK